MKTTKIYTRFKVTLVSILLVMGPLFVTHQASADKSYSIQLLEGQQQEGGSNSQSLYVRIQGKSYGRGHYELEVKERDQLIDSKEKELTLYFHNPEENTPQPNIIGRAEPEFLARLQWILQDVTDPVAEIRRIVSLSLLKVRQLGLTSLKIEVPNFEKLKGINAQKFAHGLRSSLESSVFETEISVELIMAKETSLMQRKELEEELKKPHEEEKKDKLPSQWEGKLTISPESSGLLVFPYDNLTKSFIEAIFTEKLDSEWERLPDPGSGINAQKFEGLIIAGINFTDGNLAKKEKEIYTLTKGMGEFGVVPQSTLFWGRLKSVVESHEVIFGFWATIDTPEGEKTFLIRSTSNVHVYRTPQDELYVEQAQERRARYEQTLVDYLKQKKEEDTLAYLKWSKKRNLAAIFRDFKEHKNIIAFEEEVSDLMNRRFSEFSFITIPKLCNKILDKVKSK